MNGLSKKTMIYPWKIKTGTSMKFLMHDRRILKHVLIHNADYSLYIINNPVITWFYKNIL